LAMVGAVQRSTELSQALKDLTGKQAELRALRTRYTDANPPVRQLAGEVAALEQQTIPALARSLVAELKVRETVLTRAVDSGAGGAGGGGEGQHRPPGQPSGPGHAVHGSHDPGGDSARGGARRRRDCAGDRGGTGGAAERDARARWGRTGGGHGDQPGQGRRQ